jgi:hypothetical protein
METVTCGHCGFEIRRIAELWVHVERDAYAAARHFAEPLPERPKSA